MGLSRVKNQAGVPPRLGYPLWTTETLVDLEVPVPNEVPVSSSSRRNQTCASERASCHGWQRVFPELLPMKEFGQNLLFQSAYCGGLRGNDIHLARNNAHCNLDMIYWELRR